MSAFLAAHASGEPASRLVQRCLQSLGPPSPPPSLGLFYATDPLAPELAAVAAALREGTGVPHWVGTVGLGICATGVESYDEPALAVMLADLPPQAFRVLPVATRSARPITRALADWLATPGPYVALVHGDPTNPHTPRLITELADALPGGFLVGGLTSSNNEPMPQYADAAVHGGTSGVVLATDRIPIATRLSQGCTPIGPTHEVTRCERNIVIGLDGRPAYDVFAEDIGDVLSRDLNRAAGYIFAGLPIPGSDTGDYLVRNLLGVDRAQKLLAIGDLIRPGASLMFCRRDPNTAREDLVRMLEDITRGLTAPPRGAVYVSCLGRGRHMFGEHSAELTLLHEHLGDTPLVGFYANGEISHNRLYGYTGVLTLFL
jgi:small ligand-binding sensory domain FIST